MNSDMTTFYIVRHGQTEWNVAHILQGHTDSALTDEGIKQAQDLAQRLNHISFDEVFSSDLLRAQRTAEIIAQERKIAVKTTEALRERSFGRFEGQHMQKFQDELKEYIDEFEKLAEHEKFAYKFPSEPDIHSDEELVGRLIQFVREVAVAYIGKNVLVVTHGGVMRSFLIHLGYGTSKELTFGTVKNSGYIKLLSDGVDFFLKEVEGVEKQKVFY